MSTAESTPHAAPWFEQASVADLLHRLGDVPPERVRLTPPPGQATAADLVELQARGDRLCELIEGVLVEKTVGWQESELAIRLASLLLGYIGGAGRVLGPDGYCRFGNQVLAPDVSYFGPQRSGRIAAGNAAISDVVPDLAVEVLSPCNRPGEMQNKLSAYFSVGVRLVWFIDPATRSGRVFVGPENFREIGPDGELAGGDVLPGFRLKLGEWFGGSPA